MKKNISRRNFLKELGIAGGVLASLKSPVYGDDVPPKPGEQNCEIKTPPGDPHLLYNIIIGMPIHVNYHGLDGTEFSQTHPAFSHLDYSDQKLRYSGADTLLVAALDKEQVYLMRNALESPATDESSSNLSFIALRELIQQGMSPNIPLEHYQFYVEFDPVPTKDNLIYTLHHIWTPNSQWLSVAARDENQSTK